MSSAKGGVVKRGVVKRGVMKGWGVVKGMGCSEGGGECGEGSGSHAPGTATNGGSGRYASYWNAFLLLIII